MNKKMSGLIIASAVCALFTTVSRADDGQMKNSMPIAKAGGVMCQGHNDCKGKGACKTDANSCKGQNGCAQHAFMTKNAKACKQAKGDVMKKAKKTPAAAPTGNG